MPHNVFKWEINVFLEALILPSELTSETALTEKKVHHNANILMQVIVFVYSWLNLSCSETIEGVPHAADT